jgi:hypothetical protein
MTVRDSASLSAAAYLKMYDIDQKMPEGSAKGFAEEALGLHGHSAQPATQSCCSNCGKAVWGSPQVTDQRDRFG